MPTVSVISDIYEVNDPSRSASEQMQLNANGPAVVSANVNRHFYLRSTDDSITQVEIYQELDAGSNAQAVAAEVPTLGEPHTHNDFLFCVDRSLRNIGLVHWILTCTYESVGATEDPLLEPPTENWVTQKWTAAIDIDKDSKPIRTASDENFDPPLTREFADWVLTHSKNYAVLDTAFWTPYLNAISSDTFRGFPPRTAKVDDLQAARLTRGSLAWWRITVKVAFRNYVRKGQDGSVKQHGWRRVGINKGTRLRKLGPSGQVYYEPITDGGMPVRKPVYISADGDERVMNPDDATYREAAVYDEIPFSGMGI